MDDKGMYQSIETGLSKLAIFIVIKEGDTRTSHLVTRNKNIINFFDTGFAEIPFGKNVDNNTIEAYELRYNRVVTIDTTHIHEVYYYGLPIEIAPPIFLNPAFSNVINDSMLVQSQLSEFLAKVKTERDAGYYQEHPFVEADLSTLYNIKYFFEQEYNITSEDTAVFNLFDKYEVFNILSNTVAVNSILSLHKKMFFLPAILECANTKRENLPKILSGIVDGSIFSKEMWIDILETKRQKYLTDYQKQLTDLEIQSSTLKDINTLDNLEPDILAAKVEYESLHKQYTQIIQELTQISFVDELVLYDDYRLYLRYWPDKYMDTVEFHAHIRPFTELEHIVIKQFIKAGIHFDYDSIYRKDFDFYNSIITDLEPHADAWRKFKLKRITEVAAERASDIRKEMVTFYDQLTDEEKAEFNIALEELTNYDQYKDSLEKLSRLTDIMSFWPVALYPAPDDVLRL